MVIVAGLYTQCRGDGTLKQICEPELNAMGLINIPEDRKGAEKEGAKRKGQEEKVTKAQTKQKKKRAPFDFQKVPFFCLFVNCPLIHLVTKEKPKVLESIVDGSQASSNLVNAITVRILPGF